VAPGTYVVFALKDANANMLFDLPNEIIGFLDEPVHLHPDSFPAEPDTLINPVISEADSIFSDSLFLTSGADSGRNIDSTILVDLDTTATKVDSSMIFKPVGESIQDKTPDTQDTAIVEQGIPFTTTGDSIYIAFKESDTALADTSLHETDSVEIMVYGYNVNLFTFEEPETFDQYLVEYKRPKPEKIDFFFNEALDTLPTINLLIPDTIGEWYLIEKNPTLDTLTYWLPDSALINNDSIVITLEYPKTDTTGELITVTDTLLLRSKTKAKKEETRRGRHRGGGLNLPFGKKDEKMDTLPKPPPRISFSHNINSSAHDLYRPIVITPEVPVFEYNPDLFELYRYEDTLEIPETFEFNVDTTKMRRSVIKIEFEPYTSYKLLLHEGAFTDIYGRTIDSTQYIFQTQRDDHYGAIDVQMQNITSPIILLLLDKEEKIVKKKTIYNNERVLFEFLEPGSYKMKVIYDDNDNGEWDTGIYKLKLQPERVAYFPSEIDVRSNWTMEYEWLME
jgi:hypothetical protein